MNIIDMHVKKIILQVGRPGERGAAQLVNFILSTRGPQPGAVLLEWNMHDREALDYRGECGIWNVHFRIGGADGTLMGPSNCPRGDGSTAPASQCSGVYLMMHVTSMASIYMENVWGWLADHDLDRGAQLNLYSARGFLCESQGPVWMV